jgi:hypothetical protein
MTKGMTSVFIEALDDNPADRDATPEAVPSLILRHTRRLSDRIFVAFHQACDTIELDVAEQLLEILEKMMSKRHTTNDSNRRHNMDSLVAAFERLWHLRHPEG